MDKTYLLFILATLVATLTLENFFSMFYYKTSVRVTAGGGVGVVRGKKGGLDTARGVYTSH